MTSQESDEDRPAAAGPELPAVAVLIATAGTRPEMLDSAVNAALEQDYQGPLHVTVVADGVDLGDSLVSAGETRSVTVVPNTRSRGLAGARNSGILESSGEIIAFCDDDDEWLPQKIRRQVDLMRRSDCLTCVTGITVCYGDQETDRVPTTADMELSELARRRVMEAHPSSVAVWRSALLDQIGLVDEEMPGSYGEDYDWILRAAESGRICVVSEPLVRVRWGQSMFSRNWQVIIDAIDYGLKKHPVLSQSPEGLGRLYGRRAFALAALGKQKEARTWALRAAKLNWRERRAYLAVAVSLRMVPAETLMKWAHSRGRGI